MTDTLPDWIPREFIEKYARDHVPPPALIAAPPCTARARFEPAPDQAVEDDGAQTVAAVIEHGQVRARWRHDRPKPPGTWHLQIPVTALLDVIGYQHRQQVLARHRVLWKLELKIGLDRLAREHGHRLARPTLKRLSETVATRIDGEMGRKVRRLPCNAEAAK
ncbi:hypothetical protein [Thioalkalivibrio sp. XN279]|uniref:hypothetical protein n=1 Tax=Thioalkalivibrio sp. XN279 TaxID=2714953 RepID=UPI00140A3869|nr:hypothetical protein [Thioalkalivibrio sp. XN279]NHA14156.1 hypothetical protein [Thioalkalivibrio sp. XN279]